MEKTTKFLLLAFVLLAFSISAFILFFQGEEVADESSLLTGELQPIEFELKNAFSDYQISTSEGEQVPNSSILYYLYFPKGTARENKEEIYILADGVFIREVIGINAEGEALGFAPVGCSLATQDDFSTINHFGVEGIIELEEGKTICIKSSNGVKNTFSVSEIDENSLILLKN